MPHFILEVSKNRSEAFSNVDFFEGLHVLLAAELPTDISSCKSRLVCHDIFAIGQHERDAAFAHMTLKILPGRSNEIIKNVAEKVMTYVQAHLTNHPVSGRCQLSLEVVDLSTHYFKSAA